MSSLHAIHSGQTYNACAVSAMHNFTKENFTAKLNGVSENLTFLRWVCVPNEVAVMHKLSFDGVKFGLPGHVIHRFILEGSSLHFFDGKNYMKKKI